MFSLDELSSLTSFAKRKEYCNKELGKVLGVGSSRRVYPLDKSTVLKLAINNKGVAQNMTEADWYIRNYHKDVVATWNQVDSDYLWITQERGRKATKSEIERHYGVSLWNLHRILELVSEGVWPDECEEDTPLDSLVTLFCNYELVPDTQQVRNWVVIEGKVKLCDYGLSRTVYKEYYV